MTSYNTELLSDLAHLIGENDAEAFGNLLSEFLIKHARGNSLFVCLFQRDAAPLRIYDNLPRAHERATSQYFAGVYLLDPLYNMFVEGCDAGAYRLSDHLPDSFEDSDYFKQYYGSIGLIDECAVFVYLNEDSALVLSLGRRGHDAARETTDIGFLKDFRPCLEALCVQKWRPTLPLTRGLSNAGGETLLAEAFNRFGHEVLSDREREVAIMSLRGHSVKSVARMLDISPETVKIYRKRLYQKLHVGNQSELFFEFIQFVSREFGAS